MSISMDSTMMVNDDNMELVKNHTSSFAIVQLRPGSETQLLRILLENGYTSVSFTNARGETVTLGMDGDDDDRDNESMIESDQEPSKLTIDLDHRRSSSIGVISSTESIDRRSSIDSGLRSMESAATTLAAAAAMMADGRNRSIDCDSGHEEGDLDEDEDRRAESEELSEDVNVEDEEDEEDEDEMIRRKEKALLETLYGSSSPESTRAQTDHKQQHDDSLSKLEPCLPPMEFSSLTLPTVLWGAAATAAAAHDQASGSRLPGAVGPFPYNPFLTAAAVNNPFLQQYLNHTEHGQAPLSYFPTTNAMNAEALAAALWSRSHLNNLAASNSNSQLLDTPPATPRHAAAANTGAMRASPGDSNCLITGAKLRQRGRQLRRHERDSTSYASCRLCRNRILANRLSNLHNHVRRHAVLKQFHCVYCSYAHTEVAKVRLHMLHNHKDERSQPLDKRNDDMEQAWAMLMRECFPGYA